MREGHEEEQSKECLIKQIAITVGASFPLVLELVCISLAMP